MVHTDKLETRDALLETNARLKATENRRAERLFFLYEQPVAINFRIPKWPRLAIGGSDVGAVLISMSASDAHGVSRSLSHYRCRERAPAGTMSTHTHTRRSRSRLCQKARSGPAGRSAYVPGCRTAPSLPGAMGRLAPCKRRRREGRGGGQQPDLSDATLQVSADARQGIIQGG